MNSVKEEYERVEETKPAIERERGAWSVICETEEQWLNLAESIKDKISPQDRHLHRIITQNFLPEISNMIEHKVRLFTLPCDMMHHGTSQIRI